MPESAKVRDNAFVYVDEGQTLNQQGKRQGNIVLPTIRSAWNGETLGQSNAERKPPGMSPPAATASEWSSATRKTPPKRY